MNFKLLASLLLLSFGYYATHDYQQSAKKQTQSDKAAEAYLEAALEQKTQARTPVDIPSNFLLSELAPHCFICSAGFDYSHTVPQSSWRLERASGLAPPLA